MPTGDILTAKTQHERLDEDMVKLNEAADVIQENVGNLCRKRSEEHNMAEHYANAKDRKAGLLCLKRVILYEKLIEQFWDLEFRIQDQMILRACIQDPIVTSTALASLHYKPKTNICDVDNLINDINGKAEDLKQIENEISAFTYKNLIEAYPESNKDELESELRDLEAHMCDLTA